METDPLELVVLYPDGKTIVYEYVPFISVNVIVFVVDEPLSHGKRISVNDLESMGIKTLKIEVSDSFGELLIEYHRRALKNLMQETPPGTVGMILFESTKRSFQVVAKS